MYVYFTPVSHVCLCNRPADALGVTLYFGWLAGCYYDVYTLYVSCLRQFFIRKFTSVMCQVDFFVYCCINGGCSSTVNILCILYIVPSRGCWWSAGAVGRREKITTISLLCYDRSLPTPSFRHLYISSVFMYFIFGLSGRRHCLSHTHTHNTNRFFV